MFHRKSPEDMLLDALYYHWYGQDEQASRIMNRVIYIVVDQPARNRCRSETGAEKSAKGERN
jgi:hypothetical protein